MSDADFLRWCSETIKDYITEHPEEMQEALFGNIADASQEDALCKVAVNAVMYSAQLSALFAGILLRRGQGGDAPADIDVHHLLSGLPS